MVRKRALGAGMGLEIWLIGGICLIHGRKALGLIPAGWRGVDREEGVDPSATELILGLQLCGRFPLLGISDTTPQGGP